MNSLLHTSAPQSEINCASFQFIARTSCRQCALQITQWHNGCYFYPMDNEHDGVTFSFLLEQFIEFGSSSPYRLLIVMQWIPSLRTATPHIYISSHVLCWFINYLTDRAQATQYEGLMSEMCKGVPQGSVLSPLLFTIYINCLGMRMSKTHLSILVQMTRLFIVNLLCSYSQYGFWVSAKSFLQSASSAVSTEACPECWNVWSFQILLR